MHSQKIPVAEYKQLAGRFNPSSFDARRWVRIAKDAGMKYLVITAKFHDGFALFDTGASDFNVMDASPFKRDVVQEMKDACDTEGLKLALNDIEYTRTKAQSPQTNGICERFRKTMLHEFYQIAFRKRVYRSLEELQSDLDEWMQKYNNDRTHQGKMCCGRTPMNTFLEAKPLWKEKVNDLNQKGEQLLAS
jgi:alpha-L-fucosidase